MEYDDPSIKLITENSIPYLHVIKICQLSQELESLIKISEESKFKTRNGILWANEVSFS